MWLAKPRSRANPIYPRAFRGRVGRPSGVDWQHHVVGKRVTPSKKQGRREGFWADMTVRQNEVSAKIVLWGQRGWEGFTKAAPSRMKGMPPSQV